MRLLSLLLLSMMSLGTGVGLACERPREPSKIPDGREVSEKEMLAAMGTLRRYNTDVMNYVKCLEFEMSQKRMKVDAQIAEHNDVVTKLEFVAKRFNEQLQIYKALHGLASN